MVEYHRVTMHACKNNIIKQEEDNKYEHHKDPFLIYTIPTFKRKKRTIDPFLIYTIPTFKRKKRTIEEHEYNNKPYQ